MNPPQAAVPEARSSSVLLIAQTFSAQEIIHFIFELKATFTKQTLVDRLEQYRELWCGLLPPSSVGWRAIEVHSERRLHAFLCCTPEEAAAAERPQGTQESQCHISSHVLEYTRVRTCRNDVTALRKYFHVL
jgi:hypothetical protein